MIAKSKNSEITAIHIPCACCLHIYTVEVYTKDYEIYQGKDRPLIQDIFPYLSADQRELLMTQICGKCFDSIPEL